MKNRHGLWSVILARQLYPRTAGAAAWLLLALNTPLCAQSLLWTRDAFGCIGQIVAQQVIAADMAFDSAGTPHVAYLWLENPTTVSVRYTRMVGSTWASAQEIATGIAYIRGGLHIALDSGGAPHISYIDDWTLKYARRENGRWVSEVVPTDGEVAYHDIAVSDTDVHLSYHHEGDSDLYYARHSRTSWSVPWTIQIVDQTVSGAVGQHHSLAVEPDSGLAAISYDYYDGETYTDALKYAERTSSGTWMPTIVGRWRVKDISLAFHDGPRISYTRRVTSIVSSDGGQVYQTKWMLGYSRLLGEEWEHAGGWWPLNVEADGPTFLTFRNGRPFIVYHLDDTIRIAYEEFANRDIWHYSTVTSGRAFGAAIGPYTMPHILFLNGDTLRYTRVTPPGKIPIYSAVIEFQTADAENAGSDDAAKVVLLTGNEPPFFAYSSFAGMWLNLAKNDREPGRTDRYHLMLTNGMFSIDSLSDIQQIYIVKSRHQEYGVWTSDSWRMKKVRLYINGALIFQETPNILLDNEDGDSVYVIDFESLRSNPYWIGYLPPQPPLRISRSEVEARIEAIVGHFLHGQRGEWGHKHGRAYVEASRKDNNTYDVDLDLYAKVNWCGNPDVDINFDLNISCTITNGNLNVIATNVVPNVEDTTCVTDVLAAIAPLIPGPAGPGLSAFFIELENAIRRDAERQIRQAFPDLASSTPTGAPICPAISIEKDGDLIFDFDFPCAKAATATANLMASPITSAIEEVSE